MLYTLLELIKDGKALAFDIEYQINILSENYSLTKLKAIHEAIETYQRRASYELIDLGLTLGFEAKDVSGMIETAQVESLHHSITTFIPELIEYSKENLPRKIRFKRDLYLSVERLEKFRISIVYEILEMETIDERMEEHVPASTTKPIKKFNSRIFKSESAFELFDSILSEVNAHYLREASFLFRKMQQEKFIFSEVTVQEMYLWINESYSIPDLDRLLTLDECSKITRERIYRERKLSLNLKKQV